MIVFSEKTVYMFPLPLFHYFAIGAFIISVAVLHKFNNRPLRWFIPFLLFMVLVELGGRYLRKIAHEPNTWLYNISIPVEYLFYGFILGSLCITPSLKRIIFYGTAILGIWVLINLFFVQGFTQLNTLTLKIGCSFMIITCCLGLVDLFRNDEHKTVLSNPLFWIIAGVLFFNAGEFSYHFLTDLFFEYGLDKTAKLFATINNKLIFVLYTCISIALICSSKQEKKLQPTRS